MCLISRKEARLEDSGGGQGQKKSLVSLSMKAQSGHCEKLDVQSKRVSGVRRVSKSVLFEKWTPSVVAREPHLLWDVYRKPYLGGRSRFGLDGACYAGPASACGKVTDGKITVEITMASVKKIRWMTRPIQRAAVWKLALGEGATLISDERVIGVQNKANVTTKESMLVDLTLAFGIKISCINLPVIHLLSNADLMVYRKSRDLLP
ncbi:hypothetical protein VNO78_19680 [Psophocarpus tetragonolobus]|uniref:Uncharacterized protein n=1 Tax=Psophocarpus tetragonolobus TaxID=3891 RepID=A0AAN9XG19_PSOTE